MNTNQNDPIEKIVWIWYQGTWYRWSRVTYALYIIVFGDHPERMLSLLLVRLISITHLVRWSEILAWKILTIQQKHMASKNKHFRHKKSRPFQGTFQRSKEALCILSFDLKLIIWDNYKVCKRILCKIAYFREKNSWLSPIFRKKTVNYREYSRKNIYISGKTVDYRELSGKVLANRELSGEKQLHHANFQKKKTIVNIRWQSWIFW